MKRLSFLLISFFLLLSLNNCSSCASGSKYEKYNYQQDNNSKNHKLFEVTPGGLLDVNIETGGSIKVVGWNKNVVDVLVLLQGRNKNNVEFKIRKNSGGVSVYTEYIKKRSNNKLNCSIIVKVPLEYSIDFNTMGGEVYFKNIKGKFSGKTMGGEIELNQLKGIVDMTTMGGSISVFNSDLDGSVTTMGGGVDFDNVIGNINAKTMGGNIHHNVKKRKNNSGSKSNVTIETMGGDIDVIDASYGAKVKTLGGNIHIKKAEKFIQATTMGGNIRIDEINGWVKTKTMGGNIKCTVVGSNNGKKDIQLTSMGGDIELYVPSNFSADIEIEITYNKYEDDDFEIASDFDLNTKIKRNGRNKKLIGTGTSGNGKHRIVIKTASGSVYLKKK